MGKWDAIQKRQMDSTGGVNELDPVEQWLLHTYAQIPYDEGNLESKRKPIADASGEFIPYSSKGGTEPMEDRPYEYMSDGEREQQIKNSMGEDYTPPNKEEQSKWLRKVFSR